jgi:hypothetical protein
MLGPITLAVEGTTDAVVAKRLLAAELSSPGRAATGRRMLNPITYTERVVGDFLRYQLTTYPFAARRLHEQMRRLLNLEETRATPLLKGPYISLSRSFRRGARLSDLVAQGVLHAHLPNLAPHPHVYGHQEARSGPSRAARRRWSRRARAPARRSASSTPSSAGASRCATREPRRESSPSSSSR